jgi:two-component system, sporulation sensor kinase E
MSNRSISTENLLSSIVENAFSGIMAFTPVKNKRNEIMDFKWIFANKNAAEIVGFAVTELIGSSMLEKMPGSLEAGLFEKYKGVFETGEPIRFEQYYCADGLDSWFQISASRSGEGLAVIFLDISDYKNVVAELETKGKKYQQLFEESIDPIFVLGERLNFADANSSFQKLFGMGLDSIDDPFVRHIFYSETDYARFKSTLERTQKIEEMELDLITQKGVKKHCLLNVASIYNEEKMLVSYLGVIRDMTKRKQVEEDLLVAEKLSMTGKIARTIGHEIRNPLTNLSLALEQLREEIPDDIKDAELYLSIIERNSLRIGKLITDLLNSSKPKELKLKLQSIKSVIAEALWLVHDRLNLQNMKLIESYPELDVKVPLDKDQFKIALLNLFINAIEAMKPEYGVLKVSFDVDDIVLVLKIEDNGSGIPVKDIKQLFEPFFSAKKEGAGLGLTTVQNIIHSHKGKIEVESEINRGTTIIITFQTYDVE